jgi:hypothetical protein
MVYQCELKERDIVEGVNYLGVLTFNPRETILRVDGRNYVLPGNMENIGRRARFGHIEHHDSLMALVVLADELGPLTFSLQRK